MHAIVLLLAFLALSTAQAAPERQVTVSVSYEMLKGLPIDAHCMKRIQNLFPDIKVRNEPWKRIMQSIRVGTADLTPCVFKTPEREEFIDFFGPIAELPIVLISLKSNAYKLKDIPTLKGIFHGGTSLIKDYTNDRMRYSEVSDIDGIFALIRSNRADYSIVPGNFLATRDTEDLSVRIIDATPLYIGVSKASPHKESIIAHLKENITPFKTLHQRAAKPSLVWAITNFPPYYIMQGEDAGQGISDRTVDFYINQLSDYNHQKLQASLPRVLAMMKNGEHICHGALLKTKEREEFIDFLEPNMAVYPNGLIINKNALDKITPFIVEQNQVDFDKLVNADTIRLRYYKERSYSTVIDPVLKEYTGKRKMLHGMTGKKDMKRQVGLVLSGHIDAVIGRAEEAYYLSRNSQNSDLLQFLPIANEKPYQLGQIGCSKGDWNKKLQQEINAITRDNRAGEVFAQYYQNWLPPNLQSDYLRIQTDAFSKSKKSVNNQN